MEDTTSQTGDMALETSSSIHLIQQRALRLGYGSRMAWLEPGLFSMMIMIEWISLVWKYQAGQNF